MGLDLRHLQDVNFVLTRAQLEELFVVLFVSW